MSKGQRGCLTLIVAVALAAIFCGVIPLGILPGALGLGVALPVIELPGEPILTTGGGTTLLTNTFFMTLVADVVVLALVFYVSRNLKQVPGRLQSAIEMVVEMWRGLARSMAGEKARRLMPLALTVFFLVLAANWLKLLPGVESVGIMHCAHEGQTGYPRQGAFLNVREPLGMAGEVASHADYEACHAQLHPEDAHEEEVEGTEEAEAHTEDAADAHTEAEEEASEPLYVVTPWLRGPATDLTFTFGLALVVMVMVQYWGIKEQGLGYFTKFLNFPALGELRKKPLGAIDFIVGLFEIVSEIGKIISLSFRLFGNIFAGSMLLVVLTFLIAWFLPLVAYGLELFVGAIQAFVFAILYIVFSAQAMEGHHGDEEHH